MTYNILTIFGFFAAVALCALLIKKLGGRAKAIIAHILAVAVAGFYGFRDPSVGADTREYIARFLDGTLTDDYLFSYATILLGGVGINSSQYLFILALATSLFLLHAIKNFTNDYTTAVLFLVLAAILPYGIMQYINISRQGIAVAMILYGLSLMQQRTNVRGLLFTLPTILIHKTAAIVYVIAHLLKNLLASRYGPIIIFAGMTVVFTVSSNMYQLISVFDQDLAQKYLEYSFMDTSESPYLVYVKLAWATFHLIIVYNLNKIKEIPPALYYYYVVVVLLSVALFPNALVATRLLACIDFILPVIYAISTKPEGKALRIIGIWSLVLYALVSPFVFSMYPLNFNW
ncbi:EpsG family protein [Corynebacterium sp. A21]|uniref:EpsG family protein n=1 Tax=Corynebacterium sp. A21 TaxID=3457318 RepID=UPI003FD1FBC3